jgi:hypothetical protein
MAPRQVHTGKKGIVETVISTRMIPRKIRSAFLLLMKPQYGSWLSIKCEGLTLSRRNPRFHATTDKGMIME